MTEFSQDELVAELARRKTLADKGPEPLLKPNFDEVERLARLMVYEKKQKRCGDHKQWCFERVLEAVYGRTIWDWWNKEKD